MRKQPRITKLGFIVKDESILEIEYTFDYYPGFSIQQKQLSIESLHEEILKDNKSLSILEVSRKSKNYLGKELSAFNLRVNINDNSYPVECVYQSAKVYTNHNKLELLDCEPLEAKRRANEYMNSNHFEVISFDLFDLPFPTFPSSLFYDYLYILAISQNKNLGSKIIKYDCFTDIEFNHIKQFASQARSCAIYCYLQKNNCLGSFLEEPLRFIEIYQTLIVKSRPTLL